MGKQVRAWLPAAAAIWVDMERGLYPWPNKPPKHGDGSSRVVRKQILKDLGLSPDYRAQRRRIWEHPAFLRCLQSENRRRDLGLAGLVTQMEARSGPLRDTRQRVIEQVKGIFARTPDAEDPMALTPAQYVKEGREWIRYIDEVEGRFESENEDSIEAIMAMQAGTNRITAQMMNTAMELLRSHRDDAEKKLRSLGVIEGELAE